MNLLQKFKETLLSVLPIMAIVILINFTVAPLGKDLLLRFIVGGILLIFGLTIFLLGVDIGILPIGEKAGASLTAKRNLPLLLVSAFIIGIMVTIAEPDVQVLADQIKSVSPTLNKWGLVLMIAIGVGLFTMIGLLRTVLSLSLKYLLIAIYVVVFALAFLSPEEYQSVAFDAGGATTGPMTVPFIMALGLGVASVRSSNNKNQNSSDSSFGLTGIASAGPITAVCIYGILHKHFFSSSETVKAIASSAEQSANIAESSEVVQSGLKIFLELLPSVLKEVSLALVPLVIMFIVFQIFLLKMPPVQVRRMFQGLFYSFIGLVLLLVGVNGGFMPAGKELGTLLGTKAITQNGFWIFFIILVALAFGAIVVCAEPAVWVLTEQVENVSGGTIGRKTMLVALSSGVAIAIALSVLRILYNFSLWYILIPGYAIALILTFFCPPLFMGIAFDSGGVASGPMTSTFILAFTLGVANSTGNATAASSFGVIALVAMTPLIAIQILGIVFKLKTKNLKQKENTNQTKQIEQK